MREIIEQDLCASCANLRPSQPLPTDKSAPPFGVFATQCACTEGWPRTKVNASANAISECPKFTPAEVLQPTRPWPFPVGAPPPPEQSNAPADADGKGVDGVSPAEGERHG